MNERENYELYLIFFAPRLKREISWPRSRPLGGAGERCSEAARLRTLPTVSRGASCIRGCSLAALPRQANGGLLGYGHPLHYTSLSASTAATGLLPWALMAAWWERGARLGGRQARLRPRSLRHSPQAYARILPPTISRSFTASASVFAELCGRLGALM